MSAAHDLVTVRCPRCGKFQLVEASARGTSVGCLVCKKPVPVPAAAAAPVPPAAPPNDDELLGLT